MSITPRILPVTTFVGGLLPGRFYGSAARPIQKCPKNHPNVRTFSDISGHLVFHNPSNFPTNAQKIWQKSGIFGHFGAFAATS
jgi:hypothetical protein